MAIQPPKPLDVGELINNANETIYGPVATGERVLINTCKIKNTTGTTATLTVWIGATATDATERATYSVGPEESISVWEIVGEALEAGENIIMVSGTANVLSVRITGSIYNVT